MNVDALVAERTAALLGLPSAAIDDNFFALGGDSFAAADLCAELSDALGCDVTVDIVFDAGTLGDIAAAAVAAAAA